MDNDTGIGTWIASNTNSIPSGFADPGPASGTWYAVTYDNAASAHALLQTFTVPVNSTSLILTLDMPTDDTVVDNNLAPIDACTSGLNPVPNPIADVQCGRVDILSSGAGAFDTGAGVVDNVFAGGAGYTAFSRNPYGSYSFDLTGILSPGGTCQLRFADVHNLGAYFMGMDNVRLISTATTTAAPEPRTLPTMLLLLGAVFVARGVKIKVERRRSV